MPAQHPILSPKIIKDLSDFFFEGFNDDDAAFYFNLPQPLISAIRAGSVYGNVRKGVIARKRYYVNKLIDGKKLHSGIVWFLERRFPREFAKPETQLGLVNGPAVNNTLVVSAELAEAFLARSRPIDDELTKLLKERDQRSSQSLLTNVSKADVNVSEASEASEASVDHLDGHLPAPGADGHALPLPTGLADGHPSPPSGKNPEISDLSSNKLKISEVVVKRKRGRPMKKKV